MPRRNRTIGTNLDYLDSGTLAQDEDPKKAALMNAVAGNGPGTHALIIGVGGYRHLPGGAEPKEQTLKKTNLPKQLTCPPRSAVAFAELLLKLAQNLTAPLGSIELLISRADADDYILPDSLRDHLLGQVNVVESATLADIKTAYDAWKARCDKYEENVAIFYFCGHGLEKESQILLAEDFGQRPNNPWEGAFDFDSTRAAFHKCQAKTQCFFVDACRQVTSDMLSHDVRVLPLEVHDWTSIELANNLTIKGAARNTRSLGPRRGVAYFTQALILALEGGASKKRGSRWRVWSNLVGAHIHDLLGMVKSSEGYNQRCYQESTGKVELLAVDEPKVGLLVTCQPEAANAVAALSCSCVDGAGRPKIKRGAPWRIHGLKPGDYSLKAKFNAADNFHDAETEVRALPPLEEVELECY